MDGYCFSSLDSLSIMPLRRVPLDPLLPMFAFSSQRGLDLAVEALTHSSASPVVNNVQLARMGEVVSFLRWTCKADKLKILE